MSDIIDHACGHTITYKFGGATSDAAASPCNKCKREANDAKPWTQTTMRSGNTLTVGMVVESAGQFKTISKVTRRWIKEDGRSFGANGESGPVFTATLRPSTEKEVASAKKKRDDRLKRETEESAHAHHKWLVNEGYISPKGSRS